jgi:ribonuclease HII
MAGSDYVIGADEVGTGPWAGPILVCAAIVPADWQPPKDLKDSKQYKNRKSASAHEQRSLVYDELRAQEPFVRFIFDWRWPAEIDREGKERTLITSFRSVMTQAIALEPEARRVIDGNIKLYNIEHESFPKADGIVPAVSAASVMAKVERDRFMHTECDSLYPVYGFINHVGYGTPEHIRALEENGPCPAHRMSYAPIKRFAAGRAGTWQNGSD